MFKVQEIQTNYNITHNSSTKLNKQKNDDFKIDLQLIKEQSSPENFKKSIKKQNRILGTPDYIAPEILNGLEGSLNNPSVDYWSLGVILFEFLVGVPPFTDDTVEKIFDNIKNLRIPWDEIPVGIGEDLISYDALDLLKKLLNRNPKRKIRGQ